MQNIKIEIKYLILYDLIAFAYTLILKLSTTVCSIKIDIKKI